MRHAVLVDWVHRYVGYSLTGRVTDQSLIIAHGMGSNGKSTFLNIHRALAGDMGHTMEPTALAHVGRPNTGGPSEEVANLEGARVVTSIETNEGVRLNEALIKGLTGDEPVRARRLHSHAVEFYPQGKFWIATNHKPVVADDSLGFWRRVRLLPFEQTFPKDDTLMDTLRAEMPGILAWAVRGCLEYQRRGLTPPQVVQAATDEYRREQDVLAQWIEARCILDEDAVEQASVLYFDFKKYHQAWGVSEREILGRRKFGEKLKTRFKSKPMSQGIMYFGIKINPDAAPLPDRDTSTADLLDGKVVRGAWKPGGGWEE